MEPSWTNLSHSQIVLGEQARQRNVRHVSFQLDQFRLMMDHANQQLAFRGEGAQIIVKGRRFARHNNQVHYLKKQN